MTKFAGNETAYWDWSNFKVEIVHCRVIIKLISSVQILCCFSWIHQTRQGGGDYAISWVYLL